MYQGHAKSPFSGDTELVRKKLQQFRALLTSLPTFHPHVKTFEDHDIPTQTQHHEDALQALSQAETIYALIKEFAETEKNDDNLALLITTLVINLQLQLFNLTKINNGKKFLLLTILQALFEQFLTEHSLEDIHNLLNIHKNTILKSLEENYSEAHARICIRVLTVERQINELKIAMHANNSQKTDLLNKAINLRQEIESLHDYLENFCLYPEFKKIYLNSFQKWIESYNKLINTLVDEKDKETFIPKIPEKKQNAVLFPSATEETPVQKNPTVLTLALVMLELQALLEVDENFYKNKIIPFIFSFINTAQENKKPIDADFLANFFRQLSQEYPQIIVLLTDKLNQRNPFTQLFLGFKDIFTNNFSVTDGYLYPLRAAESKSATQPAVTKALQGLYTQSHQELQVELGKSDINQEKVNTYKKLALDYYFLTLQACNAENPNPAELKKNLRDAHKIAAHSSWPLGLKIAVTLLIGALAVAADIALGFPVFTLMAGAGAGGLLVGALAVTYFGKSRLERQANAFEKASINCDTVRQSNSRHRRN